MGIGVGANTYIKEFEKAVLDAKGKNPNLNLINIKAFKEHKSWPQLAGFAIAIAGGAMTGLSIGLDGFSGITVVGGVLYLGGIALAGYNTYDYWIIAEAGD